MSATYLEMPSTAYKQWQGMDNTNQEVKVGNKENQATRTPEIQYIENGKALHGRTLDSQ
jgi:hypothetical protein